MEAWHQGLQLHVARAPLLWRTQNNRAEMGQGQEQSKATKNPEVKLPKAFQEAPKPRGSTAGRNLS